MKIQEIFSIILRDWNQARTEKFAGHELAKLITREAANAFKDKLGQGFVVKGSPGQGLWAATPWIAVMDPLVTSSTQHGFYIVYLFNCDTATVYLSLNQGVTAVKREFGGGNKQKKILEARAEIMRQRLPSTPRFRSVSISLSTNTSQLSDAYQWGHVIGTSYHLSKMPDEVSLVSDLEEMTRLYNRLVESGGASLSDDNETEDLEQTERKKLRLHLLEERRAVNSYKVKERKGYTCEACNFDFKKQYGSLGSQYIEAHHLKPMSDLRAGQKRVVNIDNDFAVLCANCHRMIHRLDDPANLFELKSIIAEQIKE